MGILSSIDIDFWRSLFDSPLKVIVNSLDILIVAFLIYRFIRALRGTKIMTLVQGVVLFILVKLISDFIGFTTISYLMNQVINYGAIAAVVIFAPELRSALETFGRTPQHFLQNKEVSLQTRSWFKPYVKAVKYMSPRKIGALVSIEQTQTLQEQIATGIPLDAVVTGELLINIFIPNTPLHDGAVIIRDNKVATACSYLPLTESNKISKEFGTRHRAAIGLSEQTDALTFVVSEETGAISIAYKGNFIHDLSVQEFEQELSLILLKEQEPRQSFFQRWMGGSKK
ncbi:MAG: diadenylate cyclase CdaA [Streptococcus salivarius]